MQCLLVLVVACTLAVGQESADTSYSTSKEYVYEYESQVMTGLSQGGKTWSGLKVKSQVLIQPASEWKIKLKMTDPRLYKINGLLGSVDPIMEMVPTEMFMELLDDDSHVLKDQLRKPVSVAYVRGHVSELISEEDDVELSLNIKRGILSLLELNFNERQSLDKDVNPKDSQDKPTIFKVIEPSLAGDCVTVYKVKSDRSERDMPILKLEKVRNLDRCIEKVTSVKGLLDGHPLEESSLDPLSVQSTVMYKLLGSPDQYIILSAKAESQYHVVPFSERAGKISTYTNQSLVLIDSRPTSDQIREPQQPLKHEQPLKVAPASKSDVLTPSKPALKPLERDEIVKKVEKVLKGLDVLLKDKVEEETGDLLHKLTDLLKKLDKPALLHVLDDILKYVLKLPRATKVVHDILPSVGTYPAVNILLEMMEKKNIPEDRAPVSLMMLGLIPKPDVFIVKRLMDYIESKDIKESMTDKLLKRSAWLALGSLGRKMIKHGKLSEKAHFLIGNYCDEELKSQEEVIQKLRSEANDRGVRRDLDKKLEAIKNKRKQLDGLYSTEKLQIVEMVKKLASREDSESKLLALKVSASLGYKELFPGLEDVILDKSSPLLHRLEAVAGLETVTTEVRDKIHKLLLPLVLDRTEEEELRSMAFITLMPTKISDLDLQLIAKSLEDEPSINVGSLIYTTLVELSNASKSDPLESLSKNDTLALRLGRKSSESMPVSSLKYISTFDDKWNMGHSSGVLTIYSSKERTPRVVTLWSAPTFLGRNIEAVEVGMRAKGVDRVLDRLMKYSTGSELDAILKSVLHPRQKRSTVQKPDERIKEIKDKLGVKPRLAEKPDGFVYIKLLGLELMYFDLKPLLGVSSDVSESQSLISRLKEKKGILDSMKHLLKSQKAISLPLMHMEMSTETGLPLRVKVDQLGIMKMDGDLNVKSSLKSLEQKSLLGKGETDLSLKSSALLELRCEVLVDMKHIKSGLEVKRQVSLDLPVSLKLDLDPKKSKVLIKLKDQDIKTPVKMESRVHTILKKEPSKASDFPKPSEKVEIKVIDETELKQSVIGMDHLGRKVQIMVEQSVRMDDHVPLPPLSGKQSLVVKYLPEKQDDLLIQIQHVTDDKEDSDAEQGSGRKSKCLFWSMFCDEDSDDSKDKGSSSTQDTLDDSKDDSFLDLSKKDLTVSYLKNRMKDHTSLLDSGSKCGFVLRLADSDTRPERQVQLTTLRQTDQEGKKHSFTVELRRTQSPEETQIWKLIMDMMMDIPGRDLKPSDLFNPEYQKRIHEQIKLSITEDGKKMDSLVDIRSELITKASRSLKKLQQPGRLDKIIEEVISYVMQKSAGTDSRYLSEIVQKQRKLAKHIDRDTKMDVDPTVSKKYIKSVKDKLVITKEILDEVEEKLDSTKPGEQHPEDAVKVLYILASLKKSEKKLEKISNKLQPVVSVLEKKDIDLKREALMKKLDDVRRKQRVQSLMKQPREEQKSTLEVKPDKRDLHADLMNIEKKLTSLAELAELSLRVPSPAKDQEMRRQIEVIISDMEKLKDKLDGKLLKEPELDRMLRVKMLEVLLKVKLASEDIEKDVKAMGKDEKIKAIIKQPVLEYGQVEEKRKVLVKQKHTLKELSKEIAERLSLNIDIERMKIMLVSHISPEDDEKMKDLLKIELKQLSTLEKILKTELPDKAGDKKKEMPSKQDLKDVVDRSKESTKKVREIIEKEKTMDKKLYLSPVVRLSVTALIQDKELLQKVEEIVKDRIKKKAMTEDPDTKVYQELKGDVKKATDEVEKLLEDSRDAEDERDREDLKKLHRLDERQEKSKSITVILKRAMKVESKHLQLKAYMLKLEDRMKSSLPKDVVDKATQSVMQKEALYEVISKLIESQDDLDKIQSPLEDIMKQSLRETRPVKDMVKVMSDKQKTQETLVRYVEEKLTDKSRSDLALMQPLHKVQQLRDKIQRQQHEVKLLLDQLTSNPKQQKGQQKRLHTDTDRKDVDPLSRLDPRRKDTTVLTLPRDMSGHVIIKYGPEDGKEKKIAIRMFGKKSLEQLLWESHQYLPSKQDRLVTRYLQDQREPDDIASPEYRALTNELNTYRHMHLIVAYEEANSEMSPTEERKGDMPRVVQELVWSGRELIKLIYHGKLIMKLPDKTNLLNRIEMLAEIKKDDRYMDVELRSPTETDELRSLRLPKMVRELSLQDSMAQILLSPLSSLHRPMYCHVTKDRIRTLKGKTIELDIKTDQCEKVLTMDCSPESSLAITSKPLPDQPDMKVITLLTKTRKIELVPDLNSPTKILVKVDDVLLTVHEEGMIIKPVSGKPMLKVLKHLDNSMEVKIPALGVSVRTDGKKVSIMVPQTMWSKLCGVCDSLDSDKSKQLEGPHMVSYSDKKPYLSTYLIPGDKCDPSSLQAQLKVKELRKKANEVKPIEETKVKSKSIKGVSKTCFSVEPITRCPPDTKPELIKSKMIAYHCLPTDSPDVDRLLKIAKHRVVDEIRNNHPDHVENMSLPEICVA